MYVVYVVICVCGGGVDVQIHHVVSDIVFLVEEEFCVQWIVIVV